MAGLSLPLRCYLFTATVTTRDLLARWQCPPYTDGNLQAQPRKLLVFVKEQKARINTVNTNRKKKKKKQAMLSNLN